MSQRSQLTGVAFKSFEDRRRSEPRTVCDKPIALLPCTAERTERFVNARMTDCSPNGLGLMLPANVPAGQQVLVKTNVGGAAALMMYTIRYCIPTAAKEFRAGARFTGFAASKFDAGEVLVDSLTRG
jgi:hypothetical protein